MPDCFGFDALGSQFVGQLIHAGREHTKPAPQQIRTGFSGFGAIACKQGDESDGCGAFRACSQSVMVTNATHVNRLKSQSISPLRPAWNYLVIPTLSIV